MSANARGGVALCVLLLIGACSSEREMSEDAKAAVAATTNRAVSMAEAATETLASTPAGSPLEIGAYVADLEAVAKFVHTAAADAGGDTKTFIYVSLGLASVEAARSAGRAEPDAAGPAGVQTLENLLTTIKDPKDSDFDHYDLAEHVRRAVRVLSIISILNNPQLVKRLLPPGSPDASRFQKWVTYDGAGKPTSDLPSPHTEVVGKPSEWNDFVRAVLDERGEHYSDLGDVVDELDTEVEKLDPRWES